MMSGGTSVKAAVTKPNANMAIAAIIRDTGLSFLLNRDPARPTFIHVNLGWVKIALRQVLLDLLWRF